MVNHRGPEGHDGNWNPHASHCYRTLRFLVAASRAAGLDGVLRVNRAPEIGKNDYRHLTFQEAEGLDEVTAMSLARGEVSTWVWRRPDDGGEPEPVGAALLLFQLDMELCAEVARAELDQARCSLQDTEVSAHPLREERHERIRDQAENLLARHGAHLVGLGFFTFWASGEWEVDYVGARLVAYRCIVRLVAGLLLSAAVPLDTAEGTPYGDARALVSLAVGEVAEGELAFFPS